MKTDAILSKQRPVLRRIFLTGGAYAPYATRMATPLPITCAVQYKDARGRSNLTITATVTVECNVVRQKL